MPTSSLATDLWETIARDAARESPVWADALRRPAEQEREAVFSPLGEERYALATETIYEAYLLHYGRPRLFVPADRELALLLGDYLYAHGLVRVAATGHVGAVADLAELISLCAQQRAEGGSDDGAVWAATAALLGTGGLGAARDELRLAGDPEPLAALARRHAGRESVERALAAHRLRVG